jgi:hypothetical protein
MDGLTAALLALTATLVPLLTWGVREGGRRAGLPASRYRALALAVAVGVSAWLGLTALLAESGVLAVWGARPPRVLLLPLAVLAAMIALSRTATSRALAAAWPAWWPLALQTFRVAVEGVLWAASVQGLVPVQMTFEGRNFDLLMGCTAPVIAALVARGRLGARTLVLWNVLGLGLLANVVGIAATSIPGPLHLDWPGAPLTAIATWPLVWIPAFLAPLAVFLHVVSLRQVLARAAAAPAPPVNPA